MRMEVDFWRWRKVERIMRAPAPANRRIVCCRAVPFACLFHGRDGYGHRTSQYGDEPEAQQVNKLHCDSNNCPEEA